MRRWSYMLGGLLAWASHFAGIYLFVSLEAQTLAADTALWQAAGLALTCVCLGACGLLLVVATRRVARRREPGLRLPDYLASLGGGLGAIAIIWQTAAVVIA